MPLYKLFCIAAHYPEYNHIKDLVQSSARFLLDQGNVVREVKYLGVKTLPQRMRRHKHYHTCGDYWLMHFDASPRTLAQLNERMRTDHRVVRWTMLKLGEKLTDIADTRQSTVRYTVDLVNSGNGTWSSNSRMFGRTSSNLPETFSSPMSPSEALYQNSTSDAQEKVAGLEDDMVASLGGTQYGRDRL